MRELLKYPTVHEALLYEKLYGDKVRCGLCERKCLISTSQKGFCKTRLNVYGNSILVDGLNKLFNGK